LGLMFLGLQKKQEFLKYGNCKLRYTCSSSLKKIKLGRQGSLAMDENLLDIVIHPNQEVLFLNQDFINKRMVRGRKFRDLYLRHAELMNWDFSVRTELIDSYKSNFSKTNAYREPVHVEAWMLASPDLSSYYLFKSLGSPVDHASYSYVVRSQLVAYKSQSEIFDSEYLHSQNEDTLYGERYFWAVYDVEKAKLLFSHAMLSFFNLPELSPEQFQEELFSRMTMEFKEGILTGDQSLHRKRTEVWVESDTTVTMYGVNVYRLHTNLHGKYFLLVFRPEELMQKKIPFTSDLYQSIINSASIDLCVFDTDHRYVFINEHAVKNPEIRRWLIGKTDFDYCEFRNLESSIAERRNKKFIECLETKEVVEIEERFVSHTGEVKYSLKRYKPIIINGEVRYVIGFGMDITHLKSFENNLAESERKYRDLFESSLDLIQSVDAEGKFVFWNKAWLDKMGYESEDMAAMNIFDLINQDDLLHCQVIFKRVLEGASQHGVCVGFTSKSGKLLQLEGNVVPRMEGGKVVATHAFFRDITERIEKEQLIQQSLAEKESLLGEIHHRVKNNLTVVYSLLELQSMKESNEKILRVFRESQTRIKAMALVHEKLYRSTSFSRIELKSYLQELVTFIAKAMDNAHLNIQVQITGQEVFLDIRDAVPCGLMMNEIVTNSVKYAFHNVPEPKITITTEVLNGYALVHIKDNGPGLPPGFNAKESTSLGLRLIKSFVNQVKGDLKIYQDNGLTYEIKIPAK
jgi:PAS domain S-box-containing protein